MLLNAMQEGEAVTLTFRRLSCQAMLGDRAGPGLFSNPAPYDLPEAKWMSRLQNERIEPGRRVAMMDKVNPIYIPRNHRVEEALSIAVEGDLTEFKNLLSIVSEPFNEIAWDEKNMQNSTPKTNVPYRTFWQHLAFFRVCHAVECSMRVFKKRSNVGNKISLRGAATRSRSERQKNPDRYCSNFLQTVSEKVPTGF